MRTTHKEKRTLKLSLVKELIDYYSPLPQLSDLRVLRFLVPMVVGFTVFFGSTNCCPRMTGMTGTWVILPQRKNDQMR